MTLRKRAFVGIAAAAVVAIGGVTLANLTPAMPTGAMAPNAVIPANAVQFPAGFCDTNPIFVGTDQVCPTPTTPAPTTTVVATTTPPTTTVPPTTTTAPATTTTVAPTTTTTTIPATTTTAPATTTTAPATTTTVPSSAACGLPSAAFCETFDNPHNGGTQTGDLDPVLWGVSRVGDINPGGKLNAIAIPTNACSGSTLVAPPADVRVCNGQMVESNNDGGTVTNIDSYPKQPFSFTGRTGTVVFDVSADSDGTHAAWPEFLITDEPVPGVRRCISECPGNTPTAKNQVGFSIAISSGGTAGVGSTGVDTFFVSINGVYQTIDATQYGTVTKGSRNAMNHFQVNVSTTRIDVYATDAGSAVGKHIAGANLPNLAFSQGLVWLNDVHYNAHKAIEPCECGTQMIHSFAWDNLGFDGPKTYRDWGFDVPLAKAATGNVSNYGDTLINEGYLVGTGPKSFSLPSVSKGAATAAKVVLNAYTFNGSSISVSVNGHTAVAHALVNTFHWESFSFLIPLTDVVNGTNTIVLTSNDGSTTVANVTLILVAAAPVP